MKEIRVEAHGGPEQLKVHDRPSTTPGTNEVLVRLTAAGINFMDTGVRRGIFWTDKTPPFVPGIEGAGRITALGEGVHDFRVGDRVAWFYIPGSYTEELVAPADKLVPIPDNIDDETAAAMMMQGLTASHFVTETYQIKTGDVALVHSAAGGLGLILTQLIKLLGGNVIGRVSTEEKADLVRNAGADHVIVESGGTFAKEVLRLTNDEGVHVVYDGAGADTFYDSLSSLRYHGVLAYYGQTIKRLPPIDLLDLPKSVLVSYPSVMHHVRTREALLSRSAQLFDWVRKGQLKIHIGHRYPLADAALAHAELGARKTTGKLLLIP
ncbi:quinone oxidoreductase [Granulicella sp. dw_53]|uniref:quinone oxidoreductase family protein n=1 Tax=Granulicella sp. dw_53 TaxID=2719792 RepID=UPI001BD57F19|nr:quinone oxidoreductase [Granulicella sp. dw_53]